MMFSPKQAPKFESVLSLYSPGDFDRAKGLLESPNSLMDRILCSLSAASMEIGPVDLQAEVSRAKNVSTWKTKRSQSAEAFSLRDLGGLTACFSRSVLCAGFLNGRIINHFREHLWGLRNLVSYLVQSSL